METETEICKRCGKAFLPAPTGRHPLFCSTACRMGHHRRKKFVETDPKPDDYTAKDIRILPDPEVVKRFGWAEVGLLAAKYKRDPGWIRRGLDACHNAGVSADYFIQRYLDGDKSIPMHEGVDAAFREILWGSR